MRKYLILLGCGIVVLVSGICYPAGAGSIRGMSDEELAGIRIALGGMECVTPEPDCPDVSCTNGVAPATCESKSDSIWKEMNACTASPGHTCYLSDWSDCYVLEVCNQGKEICSYGGHWWCGGYHGPCTKTTIWGWDDCTTYTW